MLCPAFGKNSKSVRLHHTWLLTSGRNLQNDSPQNVPTPDTACARGNLAAMGTRSGAETRSQLVPGARNDAGRPRHHKRPPEPYGTDGVRARCRWDTLQARRPARGQRIVPALGLPASAKTASTPLGASERSKWPADVRKCDQKSLKCQQPTTRSRIPSVACMNALLMFSPPATVVAVVMDLSSRSRHGFAATRTNSCRVRSRAPRAPPRGFVHCLLLQIELSQLDGAVGIGARSYARVGEGGEIHA
jgi:hypothetical protein